MDDATHSRLQKFRAALEVWLLLYDDVQHLSIAPVHEMIGLVERKLGEALEICEGGEIERLEKSDEEEEEEGTEEEEWSDSGRARRSVLTQQFMEYWLG